MDHGKAPGRWARRALGWLLAGLAQIAVAGAADAGPYRAPRTAYGAPDLQGTWSDATGTPIERPAEAAALVVPAAQVADLERRLAQKQTQQDQGTPVGQLEAEWIFGIQHLAKVGGQARSSIIVSPADGRLPYTPEGARRIAEARRAQLNDFSDPEVRPISERCLSAGMGAAGVPIFTTALGGVHQIVQTRDAVVILTEVNHEVREIRLGGRHPPPGLRLWVGDSIGRWDGDTLVVETRNLRPDEANRFHLYLSGEAKVTERFTRVSPTQILYSYEVDDPLIYREVWRGEMPFVAAKGPVYEFACHEGNYSLPGVLAGARHQEQAAAAR